MRKALILSSFILTFSFVLNSFNAEAKLIRRGGANSDGGGGGENITLANIGTLASSDLSSFFIVESTSNAQELTEVVPYEFRLFNVADNIDSCDSSTCEYVFDAGENLKLEGYNKNTLTSGASLREEDGKFLSNSPVGFDVTATFEWVLSNSAGIVSTWAPTSMSAISGDVNRLFLDTLFPSSIQTGQYEIRLETTYHAPAGLEFGFLRVGPDAATAFDPVTGEFFQDYRAAGSTYVSLSQEIKVFVNSEDVLKVNDSPGSDAQQVNAPSVFALFVLAIMAIVRRRNQL